MAAPQLMSRLDAINDILSLIGEAPLNTLADVTSLDAINAIAALDRAQRECLSNPFWFNTEIITLSPSSEGIYVVPPSYLSVTPVKPEKDHYVQRGNKLYDLDTNSYGGQTADLEVEVLVSLDWDELPQTAREAIQSTAAKHYAFSEVGEQFLYQVASQNERTAMAELYNENLRQSKLSRLDGPVLRGVVRRWH